MPLSPATLRRKMNEFRAGAAEYNRMMNLFRERERLNKNKKRFGNNAQRYADEAAESIRAAYRHRTGTSARNRFLGQEARLTRLSIQAGNRHREAARRYNEVESQLNGMRQFFRFRPGRNYTGLYNFMSRLKLVQGTRLAGAIERAYLRPGGLYSRRAMANSMANLAR